MKTSGWTKQEQEEAIEHLREIIKPGDTIYTMLQHVSRSGMMRVISPIVIHWDVERNKPVILHIGYNVAKALDWSYSDDYEGVKVGGVGMDMGFHLVYSLSYTLCYDYPCLQKDGDWHTCPSPDHINRGENRDNDEYWREHGHRDGYALKQAWL